MTDFNSRSPEMADLEQSRWGELVESRCGLHFGATRMRYLRGSVWERMRAVQISTYDDYYNFVAFNPRGDQEWKLLLELIVNGETSFFRHLPTFEALEREILPEVMRKKQGRGQAEINMWSACCSTGEEAYTMVMAGFTVAAMNAHRLRVWGTDISEAFLAKCRRGEYSARAVANVPLACRRRFLTLVEGERDVYYRVSEAAKATVRFDWFNLLQPETYGNHPFDVIFCQNALIYLRPETRLQVVAQLARKLSPDGFLFLAPGEVIGLRFPGLKMFRLGDSLIYQHAAQRKERDKEQVHGSS